MSQKTDNSPLDLALPPQSPAPPDSFLLDVGQTETWFASLPMANVGETARQIFGALVKFNRLEIPVQTRTKIVELFKAPIDYLASNLERHYLDMSFPLPDKTRRIATISRDLYNELAISYKIIITEILTSSATRIDQRLLVISLHHALQNLSKMAFRNAIVYAPWPERLWKEASDIYVYASLNNIHLTPLHKETGFFRKKTTDSSTIDFQFRQLFLFAASSPTRLRQYQILQLIERLPEWSQQITQVSNHDRSVVNGRHNIDLKEDSPPIHNALKPPTSSKRYITFDLNLLADKLRKLFETSAWEGTTELQSTGTVLGRQLLKLLIYAWTQGLDMRSDRTEINFDLKISVGLDSIHRLASDETPAKAPAPAAKVKPAFVDDYRQPVIASEPGETDLSDASSEGVFHVETCNESTDGYCLKWIGPNLPKVKTGEILGIRSSSDPKQFGLGLIRWIQQNDTDSVFLGMQILSKSCTTGKISISSSKADASQPANNCLILPNPESNNRSATLFTLLTNLKIGHDVMLSMGLHSKTIRIDRMLESTGAVAQYQFSFVDQEEESEQADQEQINPAEQKSVKPSSQNESGTKYDDLWNDL